jgi:hypothetical protein
MSKAKVCCGFERGREDDTTQQERFSKKEARGKYKLPGESEPSRPPAKHNDKLVCQRNLEKRRGRWSPSIFFWASRRERAALHRSGEVIKALE